MNIYLGFVQELKASMTNVGPGGGDDPQRRMKGVSKRALLKRSDSSCKLVDQCCRLLLTMQVKICKEILTELDVLRQKGRESCEFGSTIVPCANTMLLLRATHAQTNKERYYEGMSKVLAHSVFKSQLHKRRKYRKLRNKMRAETVALHAVRDDIKSSMCGFS